MLNTKKKNTFEDLGNQDDNDLKKNPLQLTETKFNRFSGQVL